MRRRNELLAEEFHIPKEMREGLSRLMLDRVDPIYREWMRKCSIFGAWNNEGTPTLRSLIESVYLQGAADMATARDRRDDSLSLRLRTFV